VDVYRAPEHAMSFNRCPGQTRTRRAMGYGHQILDVGFVQSIDNGLQIFWDCKVKIPAALNVAKHLELI
jgi:hypothetical protein